MGRKSRSKWERRHNLAATGTTVEEAASPPAADPEQAARIRELEARLSRMADGDSCESWKSESCPPDVREAHLREILEFESVDSGTSLFEGLEEHGINLPRPEELDEEASAEKVHEVFYALFDLRIFLIGFEHMSARELYSTLFHQTLWEGCYVKKTNGFTVIDVSRSRANAKQRKRLLAACPIERVH